MADLSRLIIGKALSQLPGVLAREVRSGTRVMVAVDAALARTYGRPLFLGLERRGFKAHWLEIPSGESSKNLDQVQRVYRQLSRERFERQSLLIALGGGVVGDLIGFVAATYLRGIPFIQVPTTLLAQVDASIGGKTGVDIPEGKNLIGSFYHPKLIWIDPSLLKSLPARHWCNGLAEVIKYGAILDAGLFKLLESKMDKLLRGYSSDWLPVIARCAQLKMVVVKKDPLETKGLRAILNFGHSVGHAIEAATGYRDYLHGEAISIGMFVAGMLSERLCGLSSVDRIRLGTLLTKAGLPSRAKRPIPRRRILEFLARDKKVKDGAVRFVLLKGLGKAVDGQRVSPDVLSLALSASGL